MDNECLCSSVKCVWCKKSNFCLASRSRILILWRNCTETELKAYSSSDECLVVSSQMKLVSRGYGDVDRIRIELADAVKVMLLLIKNE
jgi:hypothetical protein